MLFKLARCVLANSTALDPQQADIFRLINWSSFVILPKYVAFRAERVGGYLRLRHFDNNRPYLQFSGSDLGDTTVPCEIIPTADGCIRLKQLSNGKYWRGQPNWIWADSNDTSSNNIATLFRPVKVEDTIIGLRNLGTNKFCYRLTTEGKTNCLNAGAPSVIGTAMLTVEEPVMSRQIYDIRYDVGNARVYGETVRAVGQDILRNYNDTPASMHSEIEYQDEWSTTWKAMFSLKLNVKATARAGIPIIAEAKVEMSGEMNSSIEWEKTEKKVTTKKAGTTIQVPAKSKATINLVATVGTCDVPFTYMQQDTLYDGRTVTNQYHGTFTGANFYRTTFDVPVFEPLE